MNSGTRTQLVRTGSQNDTNLRCLAGADTVVVLGVGELGKIGRVVLSQLFRGLAHMDKIAWSESHNASRSILPIELDHMVKIDQVVLSQ
jgi:hypothetical protein